MAEYPAKGEMPWGAKLKAYIDGLLSPASVEANLPERLSEPSLTATLAPKADKGGATKGEGAQNIKMLRRPVLGIDREFPTAQVDHMPLWASGDTIYALGQDRRLRKTTNGAQSWSIKADAGATKTFGQNGLFVKTLANTLLVSRHDTGSGAFDGIYRSIDDGGTFTNVWTPANANILLLGPQSISQDPLTGHLFMCEYITVNAATEANVRVWRSTDDGATWGVFQTWPRSGAGSMRHVHAAQFDTVGGRMWLCTGDGEGAAGLYRMNDAGTAFDPVVTNDSVVAHNPALYGASAGTVSVMFFPDYIAWGMDATADAWIMRFKRSDIGKAVVPVERIARVSSTIWWAVKASDDGTEWVACASNEGGTTTGTSLDKAIHLYRIGANGSEVDEIGAFAVEGQPAGLTSSLSGVGADQGGSLFWLRGYNWRESPWPTLTFSPFAFRARLAWGVTPINRGWARRRQSYNQQSLSSGAATIVAGQTLTFAHTVCPSRTKVFYLHSVGLRRTSGTGTLLLKIRNVTTGVDLLSINVADYRASQVEDTSHTIGQYYTPATNDVIEMQIVETGGTAGATAVANVTFSWGF